MSLKTRAARNAECRSQRGVLYPFLVLGDAPARGRICREEPVFAGKVICGVRIETSGQNWPSKVCYNPCRRIESLRECLSDQVTSKKHEQYRSGFLCVHLRFPFTIWFRLRSLRTNCFSKQ